MDVEICHFRYLFDCRMMSSASCMLFAVSSLLTVSCSL